MFHVMYLLIGTKVRVDKLNQYVLGEPSELIAVTSSEDNRFATMAMLRQAKRNLDIVSRCLDPSIYGDAEVVEAIKALTLRGRYLRIRILVLDIAPIVSGGHGLVGLAMRLSSFIEIHRQDPEQVPCNEAFLIVDETGVILMKAIGPLRR